MKWKNIAVFVSSTFIDMDIERDALKNIVEPRLNRYLSRYRCSVDFIDLRHSVATERNMSTLERERLIFATCFDEIRRCSPYFIGFLGHRYGWIPAADGIESPENIILPESFPIDKDSLSVTASEFLTALNLHSGENPDGIRPLIYLRSPESYIGLSDSVRQNYMNCEASSDSNISRLRDFFKYNDYLAEVKEYSLPRTDAGADTAHISPWADMICEDVLKLIASELENTEDGDDTPEKRLFQEYRTATDAFMQFHLKKFRGRDTELKEFTIKLKSRKHLILFNARHGIGTSAFLCKVADIFAADPKNVVFLFPNDYVAKWNSDNIPEILSFGLRDRIARLGLPDTRPAPDVIMDDINESLAILNQAGFTSYIIFDCHVNPNDYVKFPCHSVYNWFTNNLDSSLRPFSYELPPLHISNSALILRHLRPELRETLLKHPKADNVRWLNVAINIVDKINRLDFDAIRRRPEADNEEKIVAHQLEIISTMPATVGGLMLAWIRRIATILGERTTYNIFYLLRINPYGWTESEISRICGVDPAVVAMAVMAAGEEFVRISTDGNIALSELYAHVTDNLLSRTERSSLRQSALDYIINLPPGHPRRTELLFSLAMQCGRPDICAAFIEENDFAVTEKNEDAINSFLDYARTYPLDFLRFFQSLISGPHVPSTRRYFRNLLEWCKNLWEPRMSELYIKVLNLLSQRLTAAYNSRGIDLDTYSIKADIIACLFDYHKNEANYVMMEKTLKEGLDLCSLYSAKNPWWLHYYIYFIERYSHFLSDPDEKIKWFQTKFEPLEKRGVACPPQIDISTYVACLATSAFLQATDREESDTIAVVKKVTSLLETLYENWQKGIVETRDSMVFLFNHIFSVTDIYLKMGLAGVISDRGALRKCAGAMVSLYESHLSNETDSKVFANKIYGYKSTLVNIIRLSEDTAENKIKAIYKGVIKTTLDRYANRYCPGFFSYIACERHQVDISNRYRDILYAVAVILDLLTETDEATRSNLEKLDFNGDKLIIENISFNSLHDLILPTVGAKKKHFTDGGLPPAEISEQMIILFGAMIKELRARGDTDKSEIEMLVRTRNLMADNYPSIFPFGFWSWEDMLPFEEIDAEGPLFDGYRNVMGVDTGNFFGDVGDPELVAVGIDALPSHESLESREWYEEKFDAQEYADIISRVQDAERISFDDGYYYGLALLRTGAYDPAFSVYEFLLTSEMIRDDMTEGEWFSAAVNYLTSALLSKHFHAFQDLYDNLDDDDKSDDDILSLREAYDKMVRSGTDSVILDFEPGFPL